MRIWTNCFRAFPILFAGLAAVQHIDLRRLPTLRFLRLFIQFDLDRSAPLHVRTWNAADHLLSSLSHEATLRTLVINGAFSQSLLDVGFTSSPIVRLLRRPLYNFARRVSDMMHQGRAPTVALYPQAPAAAFTEGQQRRIASLLPALLHDDLLSF